MGWGCAVSLIRNSFSWLVWERGPLFGREGRVGCQGREGRSSLSVGGGEVDGCDEVWIGRKKRYEIKRKRKVVAVKAQAVG